MVQNNIWIAAADGNETAVLGFLSKDPSAINSLDENGYTVLHAATSYNHITLLKNLVLEHGGNVNIQDHDGDTPLFVAETVEVAKALVEELHADPTHRNESGLTVRTPTLDVYISTVNNLQAAEAIAEDGEYPLVAEYLRSVQCSNQGLRECLNNHTPLGGSLPRNLSVRLDTVEDVGDLPPVDEEFRQRIQGLADRGDFNSEEGQRELRELVTEAVHQHVLEPDSTRNVRPRRDQS